MSISTIPEVDKLFGRPQSYTRDPFVGIAQGWWDRDAQILAEVVRRIGKVN